MTWLLGFLKSWKVWVSIAGAGVLIVVFLYVMNQAEAVGELQSEVDRKQEKIESLADTLEQEQKQHMKELAARDAGLIAQEAAIKGAKARASALAQQLNKARRDDAQMDTCLSLDLPAAVIDRLPK